MKKVHFYKMSGSGNDFIIIDNRSGVLEEKSLPDFIIGVCRRRLSAGADGLILVEKGRSADFSWRFFNKDGTRAEMCGNGARCVSRFAYLNGIAGKEMTFETDTGIVAASVSGDRVRIRIPDPRDLLLDFPLKTSKGRIMISSINTGVPHVVCEVRDPDQIDVPGLGREIRYHGHFAPAGTNVNFITADPGNLISIRTYERGVEDETLACGTGAIASALVMSVKRALPSPVRVKPKGGGFLTIFFQKENNRFGSVFLEGDARVIYEGDLWEEAWTDEGVNKQ
ncbi:MAG: diaminopimelate epimerase [Thermodesulfobacteriota bacterium]